MLSISLRGVLSFGNLGSRQKSRHSFEKKKKLKICTGFNMYVISTGRVIVKMPKNKISGMTKVARKFYYRCIHTLMHAKSF